MPLNRAAFQRWILSRQENMQRNIIITGASSGIGKASAEAFAEKKYGMFLTARRGKILEEMEDSLRKIGSPEIHSASFDLSEPGSGTRLVQAALGKLDHVDVLLCNAGYGNYSPVEAVNAEQMARMMQVNYLSAYESILAILPHFKVRRQGHIVLVSSILGKKGMAGSAPYSATKFAQVGLGEALWAELKDAGIKVSVICPGYTDTEFHSRVSGAENPAEKRPLKGQSPAFVARAIEAAVRKNRREVHLTFPGKLILFLERISNGLAIRIMAKAAENDPLRKTD